MTDAERVAEAERRIRYAWYNTIIACMALACRFVWLAERRHARPLFFWPFIRPLILDLALTLGAGWIAYRFRSRVAAGYTTLRTAAGAGFAFAHGELLLGLFFSAIALLFGRGWHAAVVIERARRLSARRSVGDATIEAPGV